MVNFYSREPGFESHLDLGFLHLFTSISKLGSAERLVNSCECARLTAKAFFGKCDSVTIAILIWGYEKIPKWAVNVNI